MRFSITCGIVLAGSALVVAAPAKRQDNAVPVDYIGEINKYKSYISTTLTNNDAKKSKKVCKHSNVQVRKEWRTLSENERTDYINAVQCLINKKTHSNKRKIPGARNRLDDFVASHLIEGNNIHFNGWLFAWHRHFVWLYEQALKAECNYRGAQPYWDWTLDSDNLLASPVFDGSPYSMGSNGEAVPHGATHLTAFGLDLDLPAGTGGGCIKSGPFKDLVVNLGLNQTIAPVGQTVTAPIPKQTANTENSSSEPLVDTRLLKNITSVIDDSFKIFDDPTTYTTVPYNQALNYNPRCLKRDLNTQVWASQLDANHAMYLLSCGDVDCLERRIDGFDPKVTDVTQSVHPAGHFSVGGLQNDPFASVGDPSFFLIHAQLDRLYSIWQAQDPAKRLKEVGGTQKPLDINHTGTPVKATDKLSFGVVDGKRQLGKLLSTTENYYCYSYE